MAKKYQNEQIAVTYDSDKCMHAAECVRGLPNVFDTTKRPWINIEGDTPEKIEEVVHRCPSGALSFEYLEVK